MLFEASTWQMIGVGLLESLYMILCSTLLAYILGLPMGVALVVTDKDGIHPIPVFNSILGFVINVFRSVPFLILLVFVMPFTRAVVGTTIGSTATIVPLVIGAAPFIARLVESSIKEVDRGVIEAAQSMGASTMDIIWKAQSPSPPSSVTQRWPALQAAADWAALRSTTATTAMRTISCLLQLYSWSSLCSCSRRWA